MIFDRTPKYFSYNPYSIYFRMVVDKTCFGLWSPPVCQLSRGSEEEEDAAFSKDRREAALPSSFFLRDPHFQHFNSHISHESLGRAAQATHQGLLVAIGPC